MTPLWQRPRTCSADNATARKEIETILPPADPAGGKIMCGCVMRFIRGGLGKRKSRSSKASGSTMADDTRLELAEACRFAPGIRRLFRLSRLKLEFGHKLRVLIPEENRKPTAQISCRLLVDDTRLELVTSRTSSGCATSCANRPFFIGNGYSTRCRWICQYLFLISHINRAFGGFSVAREDDLHRSCAYARHGAGAVFVGRHGCNVRVGR